MSFVEIEFSLHKNGWHFGDCARAKIVHGFFHPYKFERIKTERSLWLGSFLAIRHTNRCIGDFRHGNLRNFCRLALKYSWRYSYCDFFHYCCHPSNTDECNLSRNLDKLSKQARSMSYSRETTISLAWMTF